MKDAFEDLKNRAQVVANLVTVYAYVDPETRAQLRKILEAAAQYMIEAGEQFVKQRKA